MAKQIKKKTIRKASPASPARSANKVPARKAAPKKTTPNKPDAASKKKVFKKAPVKKATTKKVTKKKVTKSAVKKAASKKASKKKTTQAPAKKATVKKVVKKAAVKKVSAKRTSKSAPVTKRAAANQPASSEKKASTFNSKAVSTPTKVAKPVKSMKPATAARTFTPPRVPYAALDAAPAPFYNPHDHEPLTAAQLRKVKTGLTAKDLRYFRQLLLDRRAEIIGDVQGLEASRTGSSGDISHMPLHMADVGSDNYEQEFTLGLMEYERKIIIEIDAALQRIEDKTYGVCIDSGQPIGRPRLEAKPWAKYCIEVARERERRGLK